jgi:hypothetical protein
MPVFEQCFETRVPKVIRISSLLNEHFPASDLTAPVNERKADLR